MNELNNALRSEDAWVPGSRHYAAFEDHLLPRERWKDIKSNGEPPVAINPDLESTSHSAPKNCTGSLQQRTGRSCAGSFRTRGLRMVS